jgi:DNA repair protein RadC
LTKKIKAASELLDIRLHDHIIVTKNGYYSMADNGEM